MEHGPLYHQRIKEIKERRRNITIIVVLCSIIIYWLLKDINFSDANSTNIEPQEIRQSRFVDSASNGIQKNVDRPDTYELLTYKDTLMIHSNSFRVFVKFRYKDWKEQYLVGEAFVWLDSTKRIQEVKLLKLE